MFVPPALERSAGHMRLPVRLSEPHLRSLTPMTGMTHASTTRPSGMVRHRNDRRIEGHPGGGNGTRVRFPPPPLSRKRARSARSRPVQGECLRRTAKDSVQSARFATRLCGRGRSREQLCLRWVACDPRWCGWARRPRGNGEPMARHSVHSDQVGHVAKMSLRAGMNEVWDAASLHSYAIGSSSSRCCAATSRMGLAICGSGVGK